MTRARLYVLLGGILLFFSCVRHKSDNVEIASFETDLRTVSIKYAEGFAVDYTNNYIKISTRSISSNASFSDSVFIVLDSTFELHAGAKIIYPGKNKLACQSSTHLAFLEVLDKLDQVVGLCGLQYVVNDSILSVLSHNGVEELCLTEQIQLEALYKSEANLLLSYPFGSAENQNFSTQGVPTFLISEYLEESQLARLEWIKLFGLLTGETAKANAYFDQVEKEYLHLKSIAKTSEKTFIMNLPYQDQWFMPSSKSVGVELIEDAGIQYYYGNETGTENKIHANEAVWNDGVLANYWVIIARRDPDFSLDDLVAEQSVYKEFKSVKENGVIFCNTATVDYFSQGVIEPDVILKDLCYAIGEIDKHTPKYFFLLE